MKNKQDVYAYRGRATICAAFTLIELLAIIAITAMLASLLLPALERGRKKIRTMNCESNLRQLGASVQLYVHDNTDRFPPNDSLAGSGVTNESEFGGISWCPDHARTDTTDVDLKRGVIYAYCRSAAVYHCPADLSAIENSEGQPLTQLRLRSYNMSQSLNGISGLREMSSGQPVMPAYKTLGSIRRPSPSGLFVFIDEHSDTLLDSQFGNPVGVSFYPPVWFDLPSDRHDQGACFSFVDSHVERWRWRVPKVFRSLMSPPAIGEMPDFRRIQGAMKLTTDE